MSDIEVILHCPFCGGNCRIAQTNETEEQPWAAWCQHCKFGRTFVTRAAAVEAWNSRVYSNKNAWRTLYMDGSVAIYDNQHDAISCNKGRIVSVTAL